MHYSHLFASNRVDAQFSFPFGEMWSFMSIFVIINRKRQLFYFHADFVCSYCIFFSLCKWHSKMKLFVLWTMVNIFLSSFRLQTAVLYNTASYSFNVQTEILNELDFFYQFMVHPATKDDAHLSAPSLLLLLLLLIMMIKETRIQHL